MVNSTMATISWKLTEKQEKYLYDKHKYLLVEGSAGSSAKQFLQYLRPYYML